MILNGEVPRQNLQTPHSLLVAPIVYHQVIAPHHVPVPVGRRARLRCRPVSGLGARRESLVRSALNYHHRRRCVLPRSRFHLVQLLSIPSRKDHQQQDRGGYRRCYATNDADDHGHCFGAHLLAHDYCQRDGKDQSHHEQGLFYAQADAADTDIQSPLPVVHQRHPSVHLCAWQTAHRAAAMTPALPLPYDNFVPITHSPSLDSLYLLPQTFRQADGSSATGTDGSAICAGGRQPQRL